MTDKQIIDVIKCIHFDKSDIPNGCTCYWDGECNHYCYFKQLKRKEQECDNYKQALDEIEKIANKREVFCEHCNNDEDDFSCEDCGYCKILDIINKVKENIND